MWLIRSCSRADAGQVDYFEAEGEGEGGEGQSASAGAQEAAGR
jgi:hypothetical protein